MTPRGRSLRLSVAGMTHALEVSGDGSVRIPGRADSVQVVRLDASTFQVALDGGQVVVYLAIKGTRGWAFADGYVFELDLAPDRAQAPAIDLDRPIAAPMPATVLTVLVEPGQAVRQGDPLIVLEAMKMEVTLRAPRNGQIETLACAEGDLVQPDTPLVSLTDAPPATVYDSSTPA